MTDELRRDLRAAADAGGGSRPDVADLWRTGRRRRTGRRAMGIAAVVVVALIVGSGIAIVARDDDAQTVRAGAVPTTCRPRTAMASESIFTPDGAPLIVPKQAPKTPAAMVRGGGSEHLSRPSVVARVKVLSTEEHPSANEYLLKQSSRPEVWARVEVTEPVFGAEAGDRFTISDAGTAAQLDELAAAKKVVTRQLSDVQEAMDRLDRPIAELDAVIAKTDYRDPGYAGLMARREQISASIAARRSILTQRRNDSLQRLQVLQLSERLTASMPRGTSCHRFETGDDLVVAVARPGRTPRGPYELTGPSSFFLVDGNGFSEDLDAARRSVPHWTDSELLRLARVSSVDEFLDHLRDAADH